MVMSPNPEEIRNNILKYKYVYSDKEYDDIYFDDIKDEIEAFAAKHGVSPSRCFLGLYVSDTEINEDEGNYATRIRIVTTVAKTEEEIENEIQSHINSIIHITKMQEREAERLKLKAENKKQRELEVAEKFKVGELAHYILAGRYPNSGKVIKLEGDIVYIENPNQTGWAKEFKCFYGCHEVFPTFEEATTAWLKRNKGNNNAKRI